MPPEDKSEFLRARVSKETKDAFEALAAAKGKTATDQLREMIDAFILEERASEQQDYEIVIKRPPGYDYGVWKATIKVHDPKSVSWQGRPFGFQLPELDRRRIHSDSDYLAAVLAPGGEIKIGGQFVNGVWQGHIYSNGIAEEENPTSMNVVRAELEKVVQRLIASLAERSWPPEEV